ncbi:MAG: short-chain dehydrogenase/reductase [Meiothermus sp.]|mgnify:FL=1
MKNVLITGASSGIGAACAVWLAKRDFRVFAGIRKKADGDTLAAQAGNILPVLLELTEENSVAEAYKLIASQTDKLEGLVNNAGIAVAGPLEFLPISELRRQLEVNVIGQIGVTQAFLPLLRPAKGRIVMMSSISGRVTAPFFGPYSASKFALEALSDALRRELVRWGLEVSVVEPGNIRTPIWGKGVAWGEALKKALPDGGKELYGAAIDGLIRYVQNSDGKGLHPDEVAKVVEHALTAARPRTRYVVGREAKLAAFLVRLLPDRLIDRFIAGRRFRE